ncbi:MAG: penicillin-binding protein 2 [Acidimicrobiales bacterium]
MTAGMYGNGRGRMPGVHRLAVPAALPRRRVVAMLVSTMVIAMCLTARLVTLQVTPPAKLIDFSESRASRIVDLVAPRGAIVDHYNRDLVLTSQAKTIAVDPTLIQDIPAAALQLASIFSLGTTDLEQRLLEARDAKKHFAYIARQVTDAQAAEAVGLGIDGLFSIEEPKRIKPSGSLVGASVLGSTDIDNNGQSGLEKQFDAILSGKKGKLIVEEGTKGRTIPGGVRTGVSAVSGSTLVLSLDRPLQFEVDQLLAQAVDKYGAQYGVAIVSRVGTSEILANSVVRRVDGKPAEPTTENRAVTWGWEPGSIMKAITISSLIDSGTVDIDTQFAVAAKLDVHDVTYTDDHLHPTEMMTAEQIIQQSSNVGTIMMAQQLGESKLHQYLTNFGLGAPTGLGFPGESAGYVGNYTRWDGTTLSSYALGQSIIVTPMQMLMALNTIANDGVYVAPRYVLGRQTGDGKFIPEPAPDERRVISPESAAKVNQVLQSVVAESPGTGTAARVPGFPVAGKTGTAWKAQNPHHPFDAYLDTSGVRHLSSSFMGFLPADDPQLSILVILDDMTNISFSGGKVAAPVFSAIGDFATRMFNIAPTTEAPTTAARVRAKPELPPPPSTLESATTTVPATTVGPTTTTKATTTTRAVTTSKPAATSAPTTTLVATTARAPTTTRSG